MKPKSKTADQLQRLLRGGDLNFEDVDEWLGKRVSKRHASRIRKHLSEEFPLMRKRGRPTKVTPQMNEKVLRAIAKPGANTSRIIMQRVKDMRGSKPQFTLRTLRSFLQKSLDVQRSKAKKRYALTPKHHEARKQYVKLMRGLSEEVHASTIHIDEKKFNLNGPDKFLHTYHLRGSHPPHSFRKAGNQHKGLMVIGGASINFGLTALHIAQSTINAEEYILFLKKNVSPLIPDGGFVQHDNAAPHSALKTREAMEDLHMQTIRQPPCSPEFQAMELFWAQLTQRIYQEKAAYESLEELEAALLRAWRDISREPELTVKVFQHVHTIINNVATQYRLT